MRDRRGVPFRLGGWWRPRSSFRGMSPSPGRPGRGRGLRLPASPGALVAALTVAFAAPLLAGPTGPLVYSAVGGPSPAAGHDALAARGLSAAAWPLREASTGDRNLDLLLPMPAVPGESIRPVDGHPQDGAAAAMPPGLDLLRNRFAPTATLTVAPGADGVANADDGIDSAATLLPVMSQRLLQQHGQAVVDPLFDNSQRFADWRPSAAAEPDLPVPAGDDGRFGSEAPVHDIDRPSGADWLSWPAAGQQFIRTHWAALLAGTAAALVLAGVLKAYSRRI